MYRIDRDWLASADELANKKIDWPNRGKHLREIENAIRKLGG
jgi:hypothetical protein